MIIQIINCFQCIKTHTLYTLRRYIMEGQKAQFETKVCWQRADITKLKVDAIVNAANRSLRGGGGVDGAIHRAAGKRLLNECIKLDGCQTGEAKITGGYNLPSKHVIHTVGPIGEDASALFACYYNCLEVLHGNDLKSIAFPCISTGIYGYPNDKAASVALKAVHNWLHEHPNAIETVVFCLFLDIDVVIYTDLIKQVFPGKECYEGKVKVSSPQKSAQKKKFFTFGKKEKQKVSSESPGSSVDVPEKNPDKLEYKMRSSSKLLDGGISTALKQKDTLRKSKEAKAQSVSKVDDEIRGCEKSNIATPLSENPKMDHLPKSLMIRNDENAIKTSTSDSEHPKKVCSSSTFEHENGENAIRKSTKQHQDVAQEETDISSSKNGKRGKKELAKDQQNEAHEQDSDSVSSKNKKYKNEEKSQQDEIGNISGEEVSEIAKNAAAMEIEAIDQNK